MIASSGGLGRGGATSVGVVKEGLPEEVAVQWSPEGLGTSRGKV